MQCRGCAARLNPSNVFADLGAQPLANALLDDDDLGKAEIYWPLRPLICHRCLLIQLVDVPDPDILFQSDYPFFSGQSLTWMEHCRKFADEAIEGLHLDTSSRVLEIGSNDGSMMRRFRDRAIPVMGIEPAAGVAQHANMEGLATLNEWWNQDLAKRLKCTLGVSTGGSWGADLVVADNVLAHVPNLCDFLLGVKEILAPEGVAVFEFPSVGNLVKEGQFDQIYAEHHSYFSLYSLREALKRTGLHMFDAETLPLHGGSYRVYVSLQYAQPTERLNSLIDNEAQSGLCELHTYTEFRDLPPLIKRHALAQLMDTIRAQSNRQLLVVGYGASAKATVFLNYLGIGSETIKWIADTTPAKQGKYLPGVRIPIVDPQRLSTEKPDIVVNMLWNWAEEANARIAKACPSAQIIMLDRSMQPRAEGITT